MKGVTTGMVTNLNQMGQNMNNKAASESTESSLGVPNQQMINAFKACYRQFDRHSIEKLDGFYTDDVTFTDAVHSISGLSKVKSYFASMCDNLISCRFEFIGETVADDSAWFKWHMYYQHPRLHGGKMLQLTGASYIQFDARDDVKYTSGVRKIIAHEDFYDMGAMLYEHTPVLGAAIRWLKCKLAQS